MRQREYFIAEPVVDRAAQLVEFAGKKMIDAFDHNELIASGESGNERFDSIDGAVLVVAAVNKQFGFVTLAQERKVRAVDGDSQANQARHAQVLATNTHTNPGAETESRQQQRHTGKFSSKKIQSGANIALLAATAIMYAGTHARAAKIKSQNWKDKGIECLRRLVNHFIVQRPAKQWMRMADNGGHRRRRIAQRRPENRFKPASGPFQKEIARVVSDGHGCAGSKFAV